MAKTTLLVITPGKSVLKGDRTFSLYVAETGEHINSQLVEGPDQAYDRLYADDQELVDSITKRFGKVAVKFIDDTAIQENELWQKNRDFYSETLRYVKPTEVKEA